MKNPSGRATALALLLLTAACSGSTAEQLETTTLAPTTTTTALATTTQPPTTTTTVEPSITDDPQALLDTVNEAMGQQTSFLADGDATIADADNPGDVYILADLQAGQTDASNDWLLTIFDIATGDFAGILQGEIRVVDGVTYKQNPISGDWKTDDESSPNPITDARSGTLSLQSVSAEEANGGYIITGSFAGDAGLETVELFVDRDTFTITEISTVKREQRSELVPLVPPGESDVITVASWSFHSYGADLAPAVAPIPELPTRISRLDAGASRIQIPNAWDEATPGEITEAGLSVDRLWAAEDDLVMMKVTDDLIDLGIGAISLDEYVELIEANALANTVITDRLVTENTQGVPVAVLLGFTDDSESEVFIRLMHVTDDAIATNITIVVPVEALDANWGAMMFTIESFQVRS